MREIINGWFLRIKDSSRLIFQKGEENIFLDITKQTYNPEAWGYDKPTNYIVDIGTCSIKHTSKEFATRKEAVSFAIAYMEGRVALEVKA